MIIEWILAFTLLILGAFLLGLCIVLFAFYASRKGKYRIHIALMSIADVCMTTLIVGQLVSGMFGVMFPQVLVIVLVFAALILKISGLARLLWRRHEPEKLTR